VLLASTVIYNALGFLALTHSADSVVELSLSTIAMHGVTAMFLLLHTALLFALAGSLFRAVPCCLHVPVSLFPALPCFLQAMKAFLTKMNISIDQLLGRPILVDLILAYHFVPGVAVTSFYEQSKADESKQLISR
jgi:hypothetical protein